MAKKRVPMRKIREVLRLKHESQLTHRQIATACGIGPGTVSDYLSRAKSGGVSWPLPAELDDCELEAKLYAVSSTLPSERATLDFASMHRELKRKGVTLQLLWHEYSEVQGDTAYGYSHFCESYRKWSRKLSVSMRQIHHAGEKAFVDFAGTRPTLTHRDGSRRQVELFVGVLGASGLIYAEATNDQKLASWLGANERMLRFFGGSPEMLVPDCLKSAVTTPCRYEPKINRSYEELAHHYGTVVLPARPRKPKDKAKAAASVLLVTRWLLAALRNQVFFSLSELNAALRRRLEWLNKRPSKHLGASRRELFEQLDRAALRPLPSEWFEHRQWKEGCRVNIDYHVEVDRNFYSVPYALRNERVDACFTATTVELFVGRKRVATHQRLFGRSRAATASAPEHMPSAHQAHSEWSPS